MDDLRLASIACYNAGSRKEQKLAKKVFEAMDADGNGKVSVAEFSNFASKLGLKGFDKNFFNQIDKDKNGFLDFEEALLFYYIITTRPFCDMCGQLIMDMYYSCIKCFRPTSSNSCDLCPSCYSCGTFKHDHEEFIDNFALLRKQKPSSNSREIFALGVELAKLVGMPGPEEVIECIQM
ncbi:uncharacterized protein LOC131244315 [Magnolia sinica]|uniref:uncharacterized protein LOC131244315 n=1 Tax=Magnolia sinica TaxID=86752 RepID=UPI00265AFAD8|nr:uncharacterized protein LOC131244315 [Magnolia sinica]